MTEPQPSPPARRPVRNFLRRRLEGWRLRHQLPINFALHVVGIPVALGGLLLLPLALAGALSVDWYWGLAALVAGYGLQYVGHRLEGNDLGEWAFVKRLLGLPYVGIAPRWNPEDPTRL
jgi:hypothetical protein